MQNIDSNTEKEIFELANKFGVEDIDDIKQRLKDMLSCNSKNNMPLKIKSGDVVYDKLVEAILNKHRDYYQTYNTPSLQSQVETSIQNYIFDSCNNINSILKDINTLSEKTYESELCSGSLALDLYSINSEFLIKFEENEYYTSVKFDKSGLSYLRKLLQIAKNDLCLVLKRTGAMWTPTGYILKSNSSLPTFTITGPLSWEFKVANEKVTCSSGNYVVNSFKKNTTLDEITKKLCDNLIGVEQPTILELITKIHNDKQIHGALLVFIDDEQEQVIDNLCQHKRGIRISNNTVCTLHNKDFSEKFLLDICKIDGAVVFNKSGQLLSIGTILDGRVISDGDVGRGSRFNSTKTFVEFYSQPQSEWAKKAINEDDNLNCIGLVISEDKYVNLISKNQILYGDNIWTN